MEKLKTFQKSADSSSTHSSLNMINVGQKEITHRRAIARGKINMNPESVQRIIDGTLPKGNVLTLAEAAGIMAVKKTPEILPLCHTLLIDSVKIKCTPIVASGTIEVSCEVQCHAKTGVEMEALSGVSAALLCIYDLVKGIDPVLSLEGIFLDHKEGGKSGLWRHPVMSAQENHQTRASTPFQDLRVCVLTVSDRGATDNTHDKTGPLLASALQSGGAKLHEAKIVPDEIQKIQQQVLMWAKEHRVDLIVTTGGTGISPRDVTPEALEKCWTKKLDGFGEMFRAKGLSKTPHAWISRADAGLIDQTLVVMLPGSTGAVKDGIDLMQTQIPHVISMIRGEKHA